VLAYFGAHSCGLTKDIQQVTRLSERTVRRYLKELADAGVLSAIRSKSFPPAKRYRLLETSKELARAAAVLTSMEREKH